jgi:hypothetical protein
MEHFLEYQGFFACYRYDEMSFAARILPACSQILSQQPIQSAIRSSRTG